LSRRGRNPGCRPGRWGLRRDRRGGNTDREQARDQTLDPGTDNAPWVHIALSSEFHFGLPARLQPETYSTVIGEQRAFELADGSIINLNTHSRIAVHFSTGAREIELLQGEALFRVRHDASRPFRVKTTDAVVQAVGTQFNVYARGDATLVSVVEGKVAITSVGDPPGFAVDGRPGSGGGTDRQSTHSLVENQKAQIGKNGEVMIQSVPDVSEAIAWRERRLVFRSDSLEHIVQEFNRYNRRQMRLEAGIDATRQYSGVFDADDPQAFLQVLAKDQSLEVRAIEPDYVITNR
jgi:transmembrane sensor